MERNSHNCQKFFQRKDRNFHNYRIYSEINFDYYENFFQIKIYEYYENFFQIKIYEYYEYFFQIKIYEYYEYFFQ